MLVTDRWTSGAAYDLWMGRWSRLLAHEFMTWLDLPAGLQWLDVCCGSGVMSEVIAERNAPKSTVGVDVSPQQIGFARRHRARINVTFEVADAMTLPFPDASFDVTVCGLGLHYLPTPRRTLEGFRRVTRPGGTVAVYVWDYARDGTFLREFWDAAIAVDREAAASDQSRRFPMCNPEGLQSLFEQAELQDIDVHALDIVTRFSSFEDYWEPLLMGQGSAPSYLAARDPKIQAEIRNQLREALPVDAQGAINLPARAWAIRGRRP
jgi:SAM-dependent methyltransferase